MSKLWPINPHHENSVTATSSSVDSLDALREILAVPGMTVEAFCRVYLFRRAIEDDEVKTLLGRIKEITYVEIPSAERLSEAVDAADEEKTN